MNKGNGRKRVKRAKAKAPDMMVDAPVCGTAAQVAEDNPNEVADRLRFAKLTKSQLLDLLVFERRAHAATTSRMNAVRDRLLGERDEARTAVIEFDRLLSESDNEISRLRTHFDHFRRAKDREIQSLRSAIDSVVFAGRSATEASEAATEVRRSYDRASARVSVNTCATAPSEQVGKEAA